MADRVLAAGGEGWLDDGVRKVTFASAAKLRDVASPFAGAAVLLRASSQLSTGVALTALDGVAARILLAPPGLGEAALQAAADAAEVEFVLHDASIERGLEVERTRAAARRKRRGATEWGLFTSGTSGPPKLAAHDLDGLCGAFPGPPKDPRPVWSTFYDLRRYGGLQIFLRAAVGGGSLVVGREGEALGDLLDRLCAAGVASLSGTPSHWRRALLSRRLDEAGLCDVRLSGEIADQALLDRLADRFPRARRVHAYASTEAGVGFEVDDGLEGFPAAFLERKPPYPEMRVLDGTLRIRSSRAAKSYLGGGGPLRDAEGFVDTGDVLALEGGRCRFKGRRGGIINVGGLKVHPEEVEAVINRCPGVRLSLARARKSPISGFVVSADVVPEAGEDPGRLRARVLALCRRELEPHKTPATIALVEDIDVSSAGKLTRHA